MPSTTNKNCSADDFLVNRSGHTEGVLGAMVGNTEASEVPVEAMDLSKNTKQMGNGFSSSRNSMRRHVLCKNLSG